MAYSPFQFQPQTFMQSNPYLEAITRGVDLQGQELSNEYQRNLNNYQPQLLGQELLKSQLANQISGTQAQYADPMAQAALKLANLQPDYLKAQTGYVGANTNLTNQDARIKQWQANNPGTSMTGLPAEIGYMNYLRGNQSPQNNQGNQQPQVPGQPPMANASPFSLGGNAIPGMGNNPTMQQQSIPNTQGNPQSFSNVPGLNIGNMSDPDLLQNTILSQLQGRIAGSQLKQKQAAGYSWAHMPIDFRNAAQAQAVGLGYDPTQAGQLLSSDKTLPELAKAKGFDPDYPESWPKMNFAPTSSTRTALQKRDTAIAEVADASDTISSWIAPYSQTIAGQSPAFIKDSFLGLNKDQRIRFLAGLQVLPEVSGAKMRSLQGQVGIGALEHLEKTSGLDVNYFRAQASPDEVRESNKLANSMVLRMSKAANDLTGKMGIPGNQEIKPQMANDSSSKNAPPTAADITHTAQQYGISEDAVKQRLGIK